MLQVILPNLTISLGSVFSRWRYERKDSLARGGDGRPELSTDDWNCLQHVVDAAEAMLFPCCVESRVPGVTFRRVQWPLQRPRAKLTLDQSVVSYHRTAFDPVTTVVRVQRHSAKPALRLMTRWSTYAGLHLPSDSHCQNCKCSESILP